jgi:site-specific recombinase XerD
LDSCQRNRDKAIILSLVDSGARAAEFCALDFGDLDMRSGSLAIRQGKGRKDRVTFLGAKSRKCLLKYLGERGELSEEVPLFATLEGTRLTPNSLFLLLRRLGDKTGVTGCSPHTFQRTFALWSLRAGMNIYALQQIMGHSDLTMLQRYLALVKQDLQAAHEKYGAVDNMLPRR